MATQYEEHQRHREILAATILPYAAGFITGHGVISDMDGHQKTIVANAFKLADLLLEYSRGAP